MNREPIALYIFRFLTGLGLFVFLLMLYWSSTLIEDQLREVRSELNQIKGDLVSLKTSGLQMIDSSVNHNEFPGLQDSGSNLLKPDPFYQKALPSILGKGFVPWGTKRLAIASKPENLHPFSQWSFVGDWNGLCSISLSKPAVGKYESMVPDGAVSLEERINPETGTAEYWIFLRKNIFWEPLKTAFFSSNTELSPHFLKKHPVTAEDYKFWYDAMMNPFVQLPGVVSLRTYYEDVEDVRIIDQYTFVVRWKQHEVKGPDGTIEKKVKYTAKQLTGSFTPLAGFVYKYFANGKKIVEEDSDPETYRKNSVWAQNFTEHWAKNIIVSCGAWKFDGMNERQISFVRNSNFYDPQAALMERIDCEFKSTPENIWQAFKANQIIQYSLQPDQRIEFADFLKSTSYKQQELNGAAIKQIDYTDRSFAYIGWNEAKPLFSHKAIRQALTMAIDRKRIIEKNLNGMGVETNSAFHRYSSNYNDSIAPWPFNPQRAKKILEEQGWKDTNGDGILDKVINGTTTPFSFTITYVVANQTMKAIVEYISTALREIGIDCRPSGVDIADIGAIFDDKNFDAMCMMWTLGVPPENIRQLWHSSGANEKGSSNMIGFANAEADKIIDALDYEYDPAKRRELYQRFSAILHEEQPYTFLFIPKVTMVYREELQNVFLPIDRPDLIPGADVFEPVSSIYFLKKGT